MSQLQLLKPKQIAARLNCSLANVYSLFGSGKLSTISVGANGKCLRVTEEDLQAFIKSQRHTPCAISLPKTSKPRRLKHIKL